ncbi:unnamed protein product [Chironomus riparius]|uniref:Uncharacterized protein n=1 Tax=Chironomus riparius TaxID=315576 RepID=A0A9N9RTJ8_9DIPT|nr:unnamed protein product [Chironomus riparius]
MPPQKSPGPANFTLKPLVGFNNHDFNSLKKRAPQWSFGKRLKGLSADKTPGADNYDTRKVTRYGIFPNVPGKISIKHKELKSDFGPGPNKYNAVDVTVFKGKSAAKFTMGLKTKQLNDNCSPGPVAQITPLSVYKKRAPTYPMFARNKELSDGKSPGPNNYSTVDSKLMTMKTNPAYSFRSRTAVIDKDRKPGPADYNLIKHNPFSSPPCFTIRRHHSEYANFLILPNDNC